MLEGYLGMVQKNGQTVPMGQEADRRFPAFCREGQVVAFLFSPDSFGERPGSGLFCWKEALPFPRESRISGNGSRRFWTRGRIR